MLFNVTFIFIAFLYIKLIICTKECILNALFNKVVPSQQTFIVPTKIIRYL